MIFLIGNYWRIRIVILKIISITEIWFYSLAPFNQILFAMNEILFKKNINFVKSNNKKEHFSILINS